MSGIVATTLTERLHQTIGSSGGGWRTIGLAAGAAFLGYCVYFDHKRRSAPDFRKKLKERRERAALEAGEQKSSSGGGKGKDWMPNPSNPTELQAYFLQEVQLGEELLSEGNTEQSLFHLSNAIANCGQPQHLMQIFQSTLPQHVFEQLLEKIPEAVKRRDKHFGSLGARMATPGEAAAANEASSGVTIQQLDDDDELE